MKNEFTLVCDLILITFYKLKNDIPFLQIQQKPDFLSFKFQKFS